MFGRVKWGEISYVSGGALPLPRTGHVAARNRDGSDDFRFLSETGNLWEASVASEEAKRNSTYNSENIVPFKGQPVSFCEIRQNGHLCSKTLKTFLEKLNH